MLIISLPRTCIGKGVLSTFFVNVDGDRARSVCSNMGQSLNENFVSSIRCQSLPGLDEKTQRLINWNVETLVGLMKEIEARRSPKRQKLKSSLKSSMKMKRRCTSLIDLDIRDTPLEELKEIIALPEFDHEAVQVDASLVEIPEAVVTELHHLVSVISTMYNDNPFHSFGKLTHSFRKLLTKQRKY